MSKTNNYCDISDEDFEKLQNMIEACEADPADVEAVDTEELERLIKNANVG